MNAKQIIKKVAKINRANIREMYSKRKSAPVEDLIVITEPATTTLAPRTTTTTTSTFEPQPTPVVESVSPVQDQEAARPRNKRVKPKENGNDGQGEDVRDGGDAPEAE